MWLMVLLACAEEESQGVTTAVGTALDVVEFDVACEGAEAAPVPGLLDRGVPVSVQAYEMDADGNVTGIGRWDTDTLGVYCGTPTAMHIIATYIAE